MLDFGIFTLRAHKVHFEQCRPKKHSSPGRSRAPTQSNPTLSILDIKIQMLCQAVRYLEEAHVSRKPPKTVGFEQL